MDLKQELGQRVAALADDTTVYRAYRNDSDADRQGRPKPKVFYRRASENGLSVGLTRERAVRDLRPCGLCSLQVFHVRNVEGALLDVKPDGEPDPEHAEIVGLPVYAENVDLALAIGRQLARDAVAEPLPSQPQMG